ncbi:hypothetical protein EST38_g6238 [Candolleomyces aberdarensis]|uniref:Uncharacterized protein n=1 Tax=Candolleomyces aberdarensis TaxID=2316362 RepID=A0A4Q2DKD3_9AGAR|nr:hypothetical protein EST38_g6238 [Candolleomyces aberdarensis]
MLAMNTLHLVRAGKQAGTKLHPYTQTSRVITNPQFNRPHRLLSFTSKFRTNFSSSSDLPTSSSPGKIIEESSDETTSNVYLINAFTQGHVTDSSHNENKADPQYQSAIRGRYTKIYGSGSPLDAASAENGVKQAKPRRMGMGNKEQMGFVEQVGSASASAIKFEDEEDERNRKQ